MGKSINSRDPLWRSTKRRGDGKYVLWNATVALKRVSERTVGRLLSMGVEVPTVNRNSKVY